MLCTPIKYAEKDISENWRRKPTKRKETGTKKTAKKSRKQQQSEQNLEKPAEKIAWKEKQQSEKYLYRYKNNRTQKLF